MEISSDILVYKSTGDKMEEWQRAKAVLQANPSLMTPRILLLTLHNKPPLEVIEFMLKINPQAASIPKRGPTALQCAVRHHSSVDVIVCLLKACPFALLTSNLGDTEDKDPLACAMDVRADETELIGILSQPLSYWLSESQKERLNKRKTAERKVNFLLKSPEKEEMDNIKVIAAKILKAQKRQMQALAVHRQDLKTAELSIEDIVRELEEQQQERFKTQLIALDMKEKAMRHKNRDMERRIIMKLESSRADRSHAEARKESALLKLEESAEAFGRMVKEWKGGADGRIHELESKLKQECKMNEFYRKDTRLQLDHIEQSAAEAQAMDLVVFATPFLTIDDSEEPLFGKHSTQPRRKMFWTSPMRGRKKFDKMML